MATTNPPQSIADWYNSCRATFERLWRDVDDLAPGRFAATYEANVIALDVLEEHIERFYAWAEDMRAHYPAQCGLSLDYKLKNSLPVCNMVVGLLEELNTELDSTYIYIWDLISKLGV